MTANSDTAIISKTFVYFIAVFVVMVFTFQYIGGLASVRKGELADTDCYTHLNRVIQLHETGKWYNSLNPRSNAPYGESMHWTRPMDVLLLAGAWLASAVTDFRTALFWWGVVISPILLAISLVIIPWAFRPVLSENATLISLLFVFQFGTTQTYYVARADHHSLLSLFFIIAIGLLLRMAVYPFNKTICRLAGLVCAFSMWTHVESLLLVFFNFLLLGLFWIWEDEDSLEKNLHYSWSLLIFTAAALTLERPWNELASVEYDKFSLVHLFVFFMVSLFWLVIYVLRKKSFRQQNREKRFLSAFVGAACVAIVVGLAFPKFYCGGYVDIDPRIAPIWLSKVAEYQSPFSGDFLMPVLQLISTAVIGIFYMVYMLLIKMNEENRRVWAIVLLGVMIFAVTGILEKRLMVYGNLISIVPLAGILGLVLHWQMNHLKLVVRAIVLPFTVVLFGFGFTLIGHQIENIFKKPSVPLQNMQVPLSKMCEVLNSHAVSRSSAPRILASINYGPEILYRTNYEVIATTYHRNGQGILDAYNTMASESDMDAFQLIHKRKIDFILVSSGLEERNFFYFPEKQSTFYQRLQANKHPDWLKKIHLPPHLSGTYKLFEVIE